MAAGRWISAGAVFGLQAVIAFVDLAPAPPSAATLTFLDVGQGDSTLIELPDGRRVVIDGCGIRSPAYESESNQGGFSIGEDVVSEYLFFSLLLGSSHGSYLLHPGNGIEPGSFFHLGLTLRFCKNTVAHQQESDTAPTSSCISVHFQQLNSGTKVML